MKVQWDEGGGWILMGENRGGRAVMLRPFRFWLQQNSTSAVPSGTKILRMVGSDISCDNVVLITRPKWSTHCLWRKFLLLKKTVFRSRNVPLLTETDVSVPCSWKLTRKPCNESHESSPHLPTSLLYNIFFNIILSLRLCVSWSHNPNVAWCSLLDTYRHFRRTFCLLLQASKSSILHA